MYLYSELTNLVVGLFTVTSIYLIITILCKKKTFILSFHIKFTEIEKRLHLFFYLYGIKIDLLFC